MPRTKEQLQEVREKSRRHIVETSLRLFSERGFHTTSMQAIAKEAGIAVGVVYIYFKSKEELLDEIIRHAIAESITFPTPMDGGYSGENLADLIHCLFEGIRSNLQVWRLVMRIALEPGVAGFGKGHIRHFSGHLTELCQRHYEATGSPDAGTRAKVAGAMIHGTLLSFIISGDEEEMTLLLNEITQRL